MLKQVSKLPHVTTAIVVVGFVVTQLVLLWAFAPS